MKIKHVLWLATLAFCLILNGCAAPGHYDSQAGIRNWQRSLVAPMRETDRPVHPIPNRRESYTDGSFSYYHNSGSDFTADKWQDHCGRIQTQVRKHSWNNVSISCVPRVHYQQTYTDYSCGPQPAYIQGYVPLKPRFRP